MPLSGETAAVISAQAYAAVVIHMRWGKQCALAGEVVRLRRLGQPACGESTLRRNASKDGAHTYGTLVGATMSRSRDGLEGSRLSGCPSNVDATPCSRCRGGWSACRPETGRAGAGHGDGPLVSSCPSDGGSVWRVDRDAWPGRGGGGPVRDSRRARWQLPSKTAKAVRAALVLPCGPGPRLRGRGLSRN